MFAVGQFVIYGHEGVCRVDGIGAVASAAGKLYYRLTPRYHDGTVFVPVDGTRIVMRELVSPEELEDLLDELPTLPLLTDIPPEGRQAGEYYRLLLARHSCRELLQLCKTLDNKQKHLPARRVSTTDLRGRKSAAEMLSEEFAFIWDVSLSEAESRLNACLAKAVL